MNLVRLIESDESNKEHRWFEKRAQVVREMNTGGTQLWNYWFQSLGLSVPTVGTTSNNGADCQFHTKKPSRTKALLVTN